ncbi:hypothetical protein [Acinetobacter bereziniae]|nr:hypothetical protein [Acinetobacter bereziniae]MBI0393705.1 hypothetical protein [Acinetobacter bereziniae]
MSKKQSIALFAAQDPCQTEDFCYFSSLKSKVSPAQNGLNFGGKAWQCKL